MSPAELLKSGQLLLAVDVGNSRIKLGLFSLLDRLDNAKSDCLHAITFSSHEENTAQHSATWLYSLLGETADFTLLHSVVAGTNPVEIQNWLDQWPDNWLQPYCIRKSAQIPISLNLLNPDRVGIDRVLNGYAANQLRSTSQPVVVVDSGTATTVDVITAEGIFSGGAILPGLEMSARALNNYTALLPLILIEELHDAVSNPIGRDTRTALQSGLFWGHVGAIRELLQQMYVQLDCSPAECCLILTGGGAAVLHQMFPQAIWLPHLTLQGTALAFHERT